MTIELKSLIGGRWTEGTGALLESRSPAAPGVVVAQGRQAGPEQLLDAVAAARAAARGWARTPAHERGAVLLRAAAIIEEHAGVWGEELSREEGKTLPEGTGEVLRAAQVLRYQAGEGDREAGTVHHSPRAGEQILVTRKPLGVVAVVTPFNFPIAIPAWKIAPALVHGNTVVWKPASTVPLLAMRLAQALHDAGLPDGVLNLVIGSGALGDALVDHPDVDGLTFTGSTGVGRALAGRAAARGVPVQAEMGGKNAAVVLADADLDLALEQVLLGAFRSSGQKCTATSRLVVEEPVADEFLRHLAERVSALRLGDPLESGVDLGPVISATARDGILKAVRDGIDDGARLLCGGPDAAVPTGGHFVAPTVVELDGEAPLWRDELFGPVLAVRRAATVEEAFALAEDSEFGLSAALFTQDLTLALEAMEGLDVGVLHVNSESAGADPHVPFGGAKKSGYGPKEQGQAAREFFTHTTTVYLRGGKTRP
ncbi:MULTISPECIES: aldehyde dehydrogenase family protein [Arthrobacter]|uniref:Aldehyde dehydrogenase family protein n=2 Tax=Arthrobacter TaxID=1663 RepID=A0ABU9KNU8_9MICC|nr:aldehyde dehydrogenase family protein [Arthrobacter sp. YJM1]MDP5228515.1 aldehyde dehydrogenase family protein [Arthrobacter sp. YJM1]